VNDGAMSKAMLRAAALERRDRIPGAERDAASRSICDRCARVVARQGPKSLSAYLPIRSECNPLPLIERARASGIVVALPVIVSGRSLVFRRYDLGDPLVPGGFGTSVPHGDAPAIIPELVVVPVVGFDRTGTRLGYGAGHYDRTIKAMIDAGQRPLLVGIAFDAQEVDSIPHEPHDVPLDFIVTETGTMDFRKKVATGR
jgi:5-formyltetrahydrofolate cyclo-ligase